MTQPPMPVTIGEIEERRSRCRVLRQAWKPLVPFGADGEWRSGQARIGNLSIALDELADHLHSARVAGPVGVPERVREVQSLRHALGEIDERLAKESETLLSALEGCGTKRRREQWLAVPTPPEGADVLLDLLLENEAELPSRLSVVEDLVLVLATEEQRGTRRVVRDPASLTTRLREACGRSAASVGKDLAGAEAALLSAARSCEQEPPESVLRAVEEQRQSLGLEILAPRILRAVIFFDTALWNRLSVRRDGVPARAVEDVNARDATTEPDRSVRVPVASDDADALAPAPETVRWRLDARPAPPPVKRSHRRRDLRPLAAGIVIAVCTGLGLFAWIGSIPTVENLPRSQLHSVSTVLDSGYRDQRGTGPLFIGSVAADWEFLRPEQRETSAWEIIDHLTEAGVHEILLYGAERRIAMHYAEGLPVRITP